MKLFHRGKDSATPQPLIGERNRPWWETRRFSRRRLTQVAIGAAVGAELVAATDAPDAVADAGYNYTMGLRAHIPPELQTQVIEPGSVFVGNGDSIEHAVGGNGTPLSGLVSKDTTARGIPTTYVDTSKPGSLTEDIVRQAREAQKYIPPGATQVPLVLTGHNNFGKDAELRSAAQRAQGMPLNPIALWKLISSGFGALDRFEASYDKSMRGVIRETGAKGATMVLPAPEELATRAVQINAETGKETSVTRIRGNRFLQAGASLLRFGAGQRIVKVGQRLHDEGVDIGIRDAANSMTAADYAHQHDEHPNQDAYVRTARSIASMYEKKE